MTRSAGTHALLQRMEDATKPLVAAIHGNALGGGLEVAQACHFRVATKDAKVGQPEVLLGIIPGAGGTQRLPRLAGAELALEMCTDGKPVPAPKALAAGIIDRIVDGDLLTGAIAFAKAKARGRRDPEGARDRASAPTACKAGLEACEATRAALEEDRARACRRRSPPSRDRGRPEAGVRRRLGPRARAVRRLRRLDRVEGAAASVLRRARGREGSRRPEGHAGQGDQARGGRRRRHDGRRHRDDLRERRHSGPAQGRRRCGAAARAGDDPQELRRDDVEGQDDRRAGRQDHGAHHADDDLRRLRPGRHRRRSGVREHGPEEGDVRGARAR